MEYKSCKEEAVNIGDCFYDRLDGNLYVCSSTGYSEIRLDTTAISSTNTNYAQLSTYIESNYDRVKNFLRDNPELMDEIIRDLRSEKINKILKK